MAPALHFFGLLIPTYFLITSIAACVGLYWFIKRADKRRLARLTAIDLALTTIISGFIGARLFHVFYEEPDYYRLMPQAVFQIWRGGFVFYGGLLTAAFAVSLFCDKKREPFWVWADTMALPIALTYALGRIGCLLNGCCYGRESELPWAIWLEGEMRHPTQAYATLTELVALGVLLLLERKRQTPGFIFSLWLVLHALGRLIMEHFRDDPRGPELGGHSIAEWISYSILGVGLALVLHFHLSRRPNKQE